MVGKSKNKEMQSNVREKTSHVKHADFLFILSFDAIWRNMLQIKYLTKH